MDVDVIVDMQFGSTGKGAAVVQLVKERRYAAAVRVQSIQAGHTIYHEGTPYKMRTIPCAWVDKDIKLILGAGCFIEKDLLLEEIKMVSEAMGEDVRKRLIIDFRANYVLEEDVIAEHGLDAKMGSTAHGAGASLIRKLWRKQAPTRVCDDNWAKSNGLIVADTIEYMKLLGKHEAVLVEGCQGTLLSIHTSPYYPFVTTRESTAAGIIAEAGIPPRCVRDVIGVFRTLPIRVGGNSGTTGGRELQWPEVSRIAGYDVEPERTTVTNRVRRIFEFSHKDFAHAVAVNGPTCLFMTFADYLAPGVAGKSRFIDMPTESAEIIHLFVEKVERTHGIPINWVTTGGRPEDVMDIRSLARWPEGEE